MSTRARRGKYPRAEDRHSTIDPNVRHDAQIGSLPRATGACWQKDGGVNARGKALAHREA